MSSPSDDLPLTAPVAAAAGRPAAVKKPAQVHRVPRWQLIVLWPLAMLVRLWNATLRIQASPAAEAIFVRHDTPIVVALWHNRLFIIGDLGRRYRPDWPLHALISASKDGAWAVAFFELLGLNAVRGSSSNFGREAIYALTDVLRRGGDIGLTPDGPRGPRYAVKPGATLVARRAHAPILVFGAAFEAAWKLRGWDAFRLPKPFSRVRLHGRYIEADDLESGEAGAEQLREALLALNPDVEIDPTRLECVV
ncbi:DUF374 domain-containing protein [Opitutaceae bacterium TAV4]|nr:DUF374 domain-containing protein [Opitutaceae bacterium TAV4]RRJ98541.1 DUF374 domain-containing protein [Opitutaceae bacterium TAV3]